MNENINVLTLKIKKARKITHFLCFFANFYIVFLQKPYHTDFIVSFVSACYERIHIITIQIKVSCRKTIFN